MRRAAIMVSVTDDKRKSADDSRNADASPETPSLAPEGFEQLSLGATLTGPGKRTEDHFERGANLKIKGERGVFTYRHASISKAGLVSLHLLGPDGCRAVRPDQVTIVRKRRY
jgi:hypothetical protein